MNSLSRQTTEHLIQSLETGEIDHTEAAKRIAQLHTANTENYSQTLITGIVIAGLSWAITGGSIIIPAAIAFLTWESYSNQRRDRLNAFKHIAQGQILEYLPDEEREFFEPLLAEKPTEQGFQNPEDQGAAHTEIETVAQKGIHRQVLNIECRDSFLGFYVEDYEIDDPTIAEQLTTFFREWRSSPSRPTILFIDELAKLKAMQPTWYKKFFIPQCVVEGSSGETEHRFLWLATISPLIGDLGISGGDRSVFDIVTLQTVATRDHRESVKKSVASLEALPTDEQFKIWRC